MTRDNVSIPLILIHGWAGSAESWGSVVPRLREHGFDDVTAVRLPGSPGSESRRTATVQAAAEQVSELVRSLPRRAVLIGHSLGAQVSLLTHVSVADRLLGEVVIDPAYGSDATRQEMAEWADRIQQGGHAAVTGFFASAVGDRLSPTDRNQLMSDVDRTPADVIANYLRSEYSLPESIGLMAATREATARRIRPLLALHSTAAGAGRERGLALPESCHVEHWAGHGHYLHLEDPERFAGVVASWVGAIDDDAFGAQTSKVAAEFGAS